MLRKIVAGPKVRTVENGYDLDLTYVTDRVVAMAFPAEGFEKLYRNSIDDVSSFIKIKHQNNFMLFNLSGRKYNYDKFNGKVREYDWEDHQAPALYTIFQICQQMLNYLQQNDKNVVVVHCNHGKGRTGTIIVCLLLFCNFFDDVDQALKFYAKKRFQKQGYGVTQPCQVRYIHYFHHMLIHKDVKIKGYSLKMIKFNGKIDINQCYCIVRHSRSKKQILKTSNLQNSILSVKDKRLLLGDIFFDFRISGMLGIGQRQFARLNINTIFVPQNKVITLFTEQISPDNFLSKNKGIIHKDFSMDLVFQNYCECNMDVSVQKDCPCAEQLESEKMYWEKIYLILNNYEKPSKKQSVRLLFGQKVHQLKETQQKQVESAIEKKDKQFQKQSK